MGVNCSSNDLHLPSDAHEKKLSCPTRSTLDDFPELVLQRLVAIVLGSNSLRHGSTGKPGLKSTLWVKGSDNPKGGAGWSKKSPEAAATDWTRETNPSQEGDDDDEDDGGG